MTEPYSPSGTFPSSWTLLVDGEPVNHTNFIDGIIKKLIDAGGYLALTNYAGTLADASPTTIAAQAAPHEHWIVPDISGTTTYTVPDGTALGQTRTFARLVETTGHAVTFKRADGTTICIMTPDPASVTMAWLNIGGGAKWYPTRWSSSVTV